MTPKFLVCNCWSCENRHRTRTACAGDTLPSPRGIANTRFSSITSQFFTMREAVKRHVLGRSVSFCPRAPHTLARGSRSRRHPRLSPFFHKNEVAMSISPWLATDTMLPLETATILEQIQSLQHPQKRSQHPHDYPNLFPAKMGRQVHDTCLPR